MVVKWCLAGTEGQRSCPPHHYTTSCIFVAKFLWACANCNLSFLLLADRHGHSVAFCRCCRPSASRFNVLFIQRCSKQSGRTPLASTRHCLPETCSLDVFSFSHYSLWISEMFLWSAVSEIHQPDTNKPASFRVSSVWTGYILMLTSSWTGVLSEQSV